MTDSHPMLRQAMLRNRPVLVQLAYINVIRDKMSRNWFKDGSCGKFYVFSFLTLQDLHSLVG